MTGIEPAYSAWEAALDVLRCFAVLANSRELSRKAAVQRALQRWCDVRAHLLSIARYLPTQRHVSDIPSKPDESVS